MTKAYTMENVFGEESRTQVAWSEYVTTINFDELRLMKDIISLHNGGSGFDVDPCYSVGRFWQGLPQPKYKFDINPQAAGVEPASADDLPLSGRSVQSVMYDPPFVTGTHANGTPGLIKSRFSFFKTVSDLWLFYKQSLKEFSRILVDDGLLVVKCQDTISSSTQYLSHVEIINMAEREGFYCKDIFILGNHSIMWSPNMANQSHARKNHSYYIVFRKNEKMLKRVRKERTYA